MAQPIFDAQTAALKQLQEGVQIPVFASFIDNGILSGSYVHSLALYQKAGIIRVPHQFLLVSIVNPSQPDMPSPSLRIERNRDPNNQVIGSSRCEASNTVCLGYTWQHLAPRRKWKRWKELDCTVYEKNEVTTVAFSAVLESVASALKDYRLIDGNCINFCFLIQEITNFISTRSTDDISTNFEKWDRPMAEALRLVFKKYQMKNLAQGSILPTAVAGQSGISDAPILDAPAAEAINALIADASISSIESVTTSPASSLLSTDSKSRVSPSVSPGIATSSEGRLDGSVVQRHNIAVSEPKADAYNRTQGLKSGVGLEVNVAEAGEGSGSTALAQSDSASEIVVYRNAAGCAPGGQSPELHGTPTEPHSIRDGNQERNLDGFIPLTDEHTSHIPQLPDSRASSQWTNERLLDAHQKRMNSITFSQSRDAFVTCSDDNSVRLFEHLSSGCSSDRVFAGHTGKVWSAALSHDMAHIFSVSDDMTLKKWDVESRKVLRSWPIRKHPINKRYYPRLAVSHAGLVAFLSPYDSSIFLLSESFTDPFTGSLRRLPCEKRLLDLKFNSNGTLLAGCGDGGTVCLWPLSDAECLPTYLKGHKSKGAIWSVAFSRDGTLLAAGVDLNVHIWDTASRRLIRSFKTPSDRSQTVWVVAFSPDGQELASATSDPEVLLWPVQSESNSPTPVSLPTACGCKALAFGSELHADRLVLGLTNGQIDIWRKGTKR